MWQRLVRTRTGSHSERGGAGFPASTPVRGPAKCGEVPDGDLGELSQLGGLAGEKEEEEGAHRRLPDTPHTRHSGLT